MQQVRLFRLAPESIAVQAFHVPGEGWRLRVLVRRQGESFEEAHDVSYDRLTTEELLDVISADLGIAVS